MSGYIGNIPVPQATQTRQTFTATASQTTFNTAGYSPGYIDVFLNGVKLAPADYTATNGSDIVLAVGAASGDILEIVAYEIFQVLDQDFTGDFTVDGTTFVVDSTNNRVGVGTASPARKFEVHGTSSESNRLISVEHTGADYAFISFSDQNTTDDGSVRVGGLGNDLIAFAGNSERMRIDSSGNVGIGTSSPTYKVDVHGTNPAFRLKGTAGFGYIIDQNTSSSLVSHIVYENAAMRFGTNSTERMRIDSSGNLLVGTTSSFGSSGITLGSNVVYAAASSQNVANFQRYTTDGEIVRFGKDGSTVGSIGTFNAAHIYFAGSNTGLKPENNVIYATTNSGSATDNTTDIGASSYRFKDLYLSGGVYLGGVGSSNKLDDYEEGTYTVTLVPQYGTITMNSSRDLAKYVKIGSLVYVSGQVRLSSVSGVSGSYVQFSLPFANSSGSELSSHHWSPVSVYAFGYTNRDQGLWLYDSNSSARFLDSNYNYIPPSSFSGDEEIIFSFTYRTDA